MGNGYTITEIERKTGIARRTIHYYIKERIIPPATGSGGGASYNDEHILRLNLIKEMQKSHLKLSGIREALNGMSRSEMEELLRRARKGKASWDSDSLGSWVPDQTEPVMESKSQISDRNVSFLNVEPARKTQRDTNDGSYLKDLKRSKSPDETWERFHVLEGVEINVRADIMNKYESLVTAWIKYLKSLVPMGFEDPKNEGFGRR